MTANKWLVTRVNSKMLRQGLVGVKEFHTMWAAFAADIVMIVTM